METLLDIPVSPAAKLSGELVDLAKTHVAVDHRSIPKQIEYWARLGKIAEDNPDLPLRFIKDTLLALEEVKAGRLAIYQGGAHDG